jgi:ubiquinone/menaquinone biosynthesis C-methylase UbiE
MPDFSNFLEIQTSTGWGRTLADFAAFCVPETGARTLDIGCGPGLLPALLLERGCRSAGIDLDLKLLESKTMTDLCQADANELPFPDRCFNLITATNVLFLLENPIRALTRWARVLETEGMLCLLNPSELLSMESAQKTADKRGLAGTARNSLLSWAQNAEAHARWTESETNEILRAAGFLPIEFSMRVGPGFARFSKARKFP